MSTFQFRGTAGTTAGTSTFGAKPTTAAASSSTATPPGKLTYEQLDANTKKSVELLQELFSSKILADEIQQRVSDPVDRVTEDSGLMIEKLHTLLGTVNQDNQEAVALKKEYTSLLRNVDQLTALVERAGAMGTQVESRQAAWDNYQLANLPSKYFRDLVGTFESRMLEYRQTIEAVEKFVDTSSSMKVFSPGMLKEVMQAQMEYFMTLTAQVSMLHDGLQELQDGCIEAFKDRGLAVPKFVDPYAPKVKKDKAPPPATFEYAVVEQVVPVQATSGFGAKPTGTGTGFGTTTTFGAKPAGTTGFGTTGTTGYGTGTTGYAAGGGQGTTTFGAKPAGTGFGATGGTTGFGAKPAGFGSTQSFGAKPAGFGGAGPVKTGTTGFGAGAVKTGFGSTYKPAPTF